MKLAAFVRWLSQSSGQHTAGQLRRRRTFMQLHLGMVLALMVIGAVLVYYGNGDPAPLRLFWGQILVLSIVPVLLRCDFDISKLTLFSVIWIDFLIFLTAYNYGGLSAPILASVILVPVASFVHLQPAGRLTALLGLAVGIAVLATLESVDHIFPQHLSPVGERVLSAVTLLVLAVIAVVLGNNTLVERTRNQARASEAARDRVAMETISEEALRTASDQARRKNAYLAAFGRDIGAPLRTMVGFSQIISRDLHNQGTPESYRGYAEDIESSGRKLLQVVHAIEDLARYEANDLELSIEGVDLRLVLQSAVADLKELAEHRDIEMSFSCRTDDVMVAGDAKRLSQMIYHLIANAVQHETFGGEVEVFLGNCDEHYVAAEIANRNAVMDVDTLSRLRTLFSPANDDTQLRPGQGVGMPLVATLLKLHQGLIKITSNDETGTVVEVRLPRVAFEQQQAGENPETLPFV
jgi:signal transduction histidine kinase